MELQYFDYINWQNQLYSREYSKQLKKYWEQNLAQIPVELNLPYDFQSSALLGYSGTVHLDDLGVEQVSQIQHFGKKHNISSFIIVFSAFSAFLKSICQQEKFLIGVPLMSSWLKTPQHKNVVGMLANLVICPINLIGNPSFYDVLKQGNQVLEEADKYRDYPFVEMAMDLSQQQESIKSFPIQVAFSWEIDPCHGITELDDSLSVEPYPLGEQGGGAFDIYLTAMEVGEKLQLCWKYNTDRFRPETIISLAQQFKTFLMSAIAQPEQPLKTLPLTTETETEEEWDFEITESCIHHWFEAQAKLLPQQTAVIDEETQFTYEQLNAAANQVAHYLQSFGVGAETLVGILMPRCLNWMVAMLGTLKAGAAYVPLDLTYPPQRIADMLEDAQVSFLFVQGNLDCLPPTSAKVIDLHQDRELIAQYPTDNPTSPVTPHNLAYVIYTSGSTGKPKGVMIEHRSLVNFIQKAVHEYEITERDRVLQFASLSFDAAVEEIYISLIAGATLVLRPAAMLDSMTTFLKICHKHQLTVLDLPTAYWHLLVEVLVEQPVLTFPPSVRCVIIGGERANPYYIEQWQRCVGASPVLINTYGPTETTVVATTYRLPAKESVASELPIGKPLPHVETYILDEKQQPVPLGEAGELYLGGIALARGYLNRPAATAKSFIPNPFCKQPQARLYKTGDLVKALPDGNLEFLGRIDQQVKIRGFRVDISEIEGTITTYPGIHQVFVTAQPDQLGHQQMVAYLVSDFIPDRISYEVACSLEYEGEFFTLTTVDISSFGVGLQDAPPGLSQGDQVRLCFPLPNQAGEHWFHGQVVWHQGTRLGVQLEPIPLEQSLLQESAEYLLEVQGILKALQRAVTGTLRKYLQRKLPDYMIPANFVLMNALPLTPNGKVDQQLLPLPHLEQNELSASKPNLPENETEQLVAAIWSPLLGVQGITVEDNFFELGGNSLLAIQCINRLTQELQQTIPVSMLVQNPTLGRFASAIAAAVPNPVDTPPLDLKAEAQLDPTIQYSLPPNWAKVESPSAIFLTGATGFVGSYLLSELLQQTNADVYCLVRYRPGESSRERLKHQLQSQALWQENFRHRIMPVVGNLEQPLLGLSEEQFQDLAHCINVIYHNGAWVNFVYPYSQLRAANVQGTQEVLRLASCAQTKPVHFVSTLSVFPDCYADQGLVLETDIPHFEHELQTGYDQSKWVAETLIRQAQGRGLPITIYRLGTLLGNSQTGLTKKKNDFFWSFIRGCVQLGAVPLLTRNINLTPVDYITQAMVSLSQTSSQWGQTFHLINPHSISWETFVSYLQCSGYDLKIEPYNQWLSQLKQQCQMGIHNDLTPFLPLLTSEADFPLEKPAFNTSLSEMALSHFSIHCPPLDEHLIKKYLTALDKK
ncbi:MAG: amino acid adenylation domain-containing protein [Cyanobacteria bacterium]|jgi:amino acid adenylation domain-containing protein/thioester reductase-like protein|nr:amino acid adenylation domain-containing protein [Cyanobacteria bacterium GSL.Bin21]